MRLRTNNLFPLVVLVLLSGLSFWLRQTAEHESPGRSGTMRHDPDSIVEKLSVRRFGADGSLQSELGAVRLVHYADDDTSFVEQPRYMFANRDGPVNISAAVAHIGEAGKRVELQNDVMVRRPAQRKTPERVLTTTHLTIFPDDQLVRTDAPVDIVEGKSHMRGVGLEADGINGYVTLQSRVSGTFDRRKK
ncbi:MAG: LPS export ABC transporter periplasmic protein LptC [Rhodocyclaceae bacterium]|nr:LPS export ABC transporter periplasmic protein LptC [Rhodocyclaceae bacterium]MBX3666793.1 LPS export ABC transporter periplasmic protein LptC [Rhodocyclaceae bacterium]